MSVIALDLGATKLASALFDEGGELIWSHSETLNKRQGHDVAEMISMACFSLIRKSNDQAPASLGICVPGIYYDKTGKVWAPNIPGWEDFSLLDFLENELKNEKVRIKIDSDRACYILGEVWAGNAKGCSDAIFLAVGTGIGAGILVNQQVLRGANDISGAIGWMALDRPFNESYKSCGCFESNGSGEGIVKYILNAIKNKNSPQSSLMRLNPASIKTKDIFDAFEKNDRLATMAIDNAIECWGMAVANLVSIFNPQKIIFGGGVFGPALKFLDAIYDEAKKWAQPISIQQVKLEGSSLGSDAGLYGAGYLAMM